MDRILVHIVFHNFFRQPVTGKIPANGLSAFQKLLLCGHTAKLIGPGIQLQSFDMRAVRRFQHFLQLIHPDTHRRAHDNRPVENMSVF